MTNLSLVRPARTGFVIGLLALAAFGASEGVEPPPPAELPVAGTRLALIGDGRSWRPPSDESPPHPGEVAAIALTWPPDTRPSNGDIVVKIAATGASSISIRRLVVSDSRAGGADVVEVLLLSLGSTVIPPLELSDGTGRSLAVTEPLELNVAPELSETDAQPAPARPPVDLGLDRPGLLAVAGVSLALLAALWWSWRRWRRRFRADAAGAPEEPTEPAEVRALRELDQLLRSALLARGGIKPFCIRLAEIGKAYVGAAHGVPLLERTTFECVRDLRACAADSPTINWLSAWLDRIDLVKFAEDRPDNSAALELASTLRERIQIRRPIAHDAEPLSDAPGPRTASASATGGR